MVAGGDFLNGRRDMRERYLDRYLHAGKPYGVASEYRLYKHQKWSRPSGKARRA